MLGLAALLLALLLATPAAAQTSGSSSPKRVLGVYGNFTPGGMLLTRIVPGSPAEQAGLLPGDWILKVDEQVIRSQQDYEQALVASADLVGLMVRRKTNRQLERVIANLAGGPPVAPYMLGIRGNFTAQGMLITSVGVTTSAGRIGLQPGDLITRINGKRIADQNAFFQVMYDSAGHVEVAVIKVGTGQPVLLRASLPVFQLGVIGDYSPQGMLIAIVAPLTPAARAGLRRGDILASIDGKFIGSQAALEAALGKSHGSVVLQVRQAGQGPRKKMEVTLMNSPLGSWTRTAKDGVQVEAVAEATPAQRAGLRPGDLILRVDDKRIGSQDDLLRALDGVRGQTTLRVRQAQSGDVAELAVDLSRR